MSEKPLHWSGSEQLDALRDQISHGKPFCISPACFEPRAPGKEHCAVCEFYANEDHNPHTNAMKEAAQ